MYNTEEVKTACSKGNNESAQTSDRTMESMLLQSPREKERKISCHGTDVHDRYSTIGVDLSPPRCCPEVYVLRCRDLVACAASEEVSSS